MNVTRAFPGGTGFFWVLPCGDVQRVYGKPMAWQPMYVYPPGPKHGSARFLMATDESVHIVPLDNLIAGAGAWCPFAPPEGSAP